MTSTLTWPCGDPPAEQRAPTREDPLRTGRLAEQCRAAVQGDRR